MAADGGAGAAGRRGAGPPVRGALAAELRAVGITLDYAPVLDIHTNPNNPIIGDRALSEDAAMVARLGAAIIEELQRGGLAACGKHFPGHGDTSVDSHLELPLVEHPPDRIRRVECVPFARQSRPAWRSS
jgi:beta-N-acetylhexosaminidase